MNTAKRSSASISAATAATCAAATSSPSRPPVTAQAAMSTLGSAATDSSTVSTDTKTATERDTTQYRAASEHLSGPRFLTFPIEGLRLRRKRLCRPTIRLRVRDSASSEGAPKPKGTTCCRASRLFLSHLQRASPSAKAATPPNSTLRVRDSATV